MKVIDAVLLTLVIILLLYLVINKTDNFENKKQKAKEIYTVSKPHIINGKKTFNELKKVLPETDAVLYTQLKELRREGNFTPNHIEQIL